MSRQVPTETRESRVCKSARRCWARASRLSAASCGFSEVVWDMAAISFLSESEVEEYIVGRIHKQNTHDNQQRKAYRSGADTPNGVDRIAFVFEKVALDLRQDRQAEGNRRREKENIIAQGGPGDRIGKRRGVCKHADAGQIEEKLAELAEILEVKDAEADDDNELAVNMLPPNRPFFHALFAELLLEENEEAEIEAPKDEIPRGAVPHAGAEPDEKKAYVLAVFAEDRHIEQIITEEGAERNMPALPEFRNRLAGKGMTEVFVKMKAEHAAEADRNIGIAAEIKVDVQGIGNHGIPCTEHGEPGDVLAEEGIDNYPEVVGDDDLFREADDHAQRALAQVVHRCAAVVDFILDHAVADDRACDKLREQRDIKKEFRIVLLYVYGFPVAVEHIGDGLKGVKADADRQCDLRYRNAGAENTVDVLNEESAVLEDEQKQDIQRDAARYGELCPLCLPVFFNLQADEPVECGAEKKQEDPKRLTPRVEDQRKDDQHRVFSAELFSQRIRNQAERQKKVDEEQIGKNHRRDPLISHLKRRDAAAVRLKF